MDPMRIFLVHNRYKQAGGEDAEFEAEGKLLRQCGHEVLDFVKDNAIVDGMPHLRLAADTIWSQSSRKKLEQLLRENKSDIVHFHNTLPLISPAAYYAAKAEGVPVVQTLHNYRFLCPNGLFFRHGHVCEDCLHKAIAWPGVPHSCYQTSRPATGMVAAMLAVHRGMGTWTKVVDRYIALTTFAKAKFVEGGLPSDRIVVKPSFVEDRRRKAADGAVRQGALFVERLNPEKGVHTLLRAWSSVDTPLRVVGDGPLLEDVRSASALALVSLGWMTPDEVVAEMGCAAFLVMPSECYEVFPMTLAEAFCQGLPVIASRLGAMAEVVEDRVTGLHFTPDDAGDLAAKVRWAVEHPDEMRVMGVNARRVYEEKYTPEVNYRQLMAIYDQAIESRRRSRRDLAYSR